ncbi:MAG TPA: DUF502 domain-containing protein [Planctomycetota bacterium]|nr:DUF502 domain-containing protein [Planctomycetota bacterium]
MTLIVRYFLRGLLFGAPIALTVGVCYMVFDKVDDLMAVPVKAIFGEPVRGVGFGFVLVTILALGVLASHFLTWRLMSVFEKLLERLPMVKLLYTSVRDLLSSFVGEKKRFDKPVQIRPFPGSEVAMLGFVTRGDLSALKLPGKVAVYVPQSYNFAGNLLIVPRECVAPLDVDSSAVMAFVVSGGASLPLPGADDASQDDSRRMAATAE